MFIEIKLYAHRKCVQHWCNEKGDITCEICHQPYQPGYIAPPPRARLEETTIDIGQKKKKKKKKTGRFINRPGSGPNRVFFTKRKN
ncbi:putative E3 ubiquitin-protein ligase MARCH [Helianthus annuus]|nr:putative E3 ubiquitin-protein ligase MARCH [Helianthus annuus]KAJ0676434.1 putative E3 ubiquitin-protein ligase MARCH [Helianthus annuus]